MVDDNGEAISIYEQADIGEFFLNFLERMQDGLGESKALMRKLMGDDLINNLRESRALSGSQKETEERRFDNNFKQINNEVGADVFNVNQTIEEALTERTISDDTPGNDAASEMDFENLD